MTKPILSLAFVFALTVGSVMYGAEHQSSGSSNSSSASQDSGSSSTSQNSNTTTENGTPTVDDKSVTNNVNQAFGADKVLSSGGIMVNSKKGVVTLRGSLSSEMEIDRAIEVAKGVEGVQSVDSQLVVGQPNNSTSPNPPNTMENKDTSRRNTTTGNIDSNSQSNSPNPNASALTTEDKSRRNDPTVNANSMTPNSDSQITKELESQLKADKHLTANQVTAEVVNGNVVLRGNVSDKAEETRIIDMVKQTKGVTNVQSMLVLENANPR
jgi:osmotically-inducible protein OsmY